MASNDRVSVTIVTYNSGRFIKRCLESVLEQKYANLEVIVIDNASTDGTVDILEQFDGSLPDLLQRRKHRLRRGAESGHRAGPRGVGPDAESGRAAASEFHSGAGGGRTSGSQGGHGVRQTADHPPQLRSSR